MRFWLIVSLIVTLAALGASLYVSLIAPELLPEQVPTHWNIKGEVDSRMPRDQAWKVLLLMPGAMALIVGLTLVLPWLSPKGFNPERFHATYYFIMGVVVLLMAYLDAVILVASMEWKIDIGRWLLGGLFLFFAVLGNVMGKIRRNFWVGVRTPWTIASETVWNQTHRLAGWLWVAAGIAGFVGSLAGVPMPVCIGVLVLAAVVPVLYSLILYKKLERSGRLKEDAPEVSDPVA
jgi:uncharacterized membrane protein